MLESERTIRTLDVLFTSTPAPRTSAGSWVRLLGVELEGETESSAAAAGEEHAFRAVEPQLAAMSDAIAAAERQGAAP